VNRSYSHSVSGRREALRVFTIGHSTKTFAELVQPLLVHHVNILADVRRFPHSFRNPQFNIEAMKTELPKYNIRYAWLQKLGGRREGFGQESKNTCWKNKSFRNYADYMETSDFIDGARELVRLAGIGTLVIMCAEAVYWRCHRSMISDFLKAKGLEVMHIFDETHSHEHEYTRCAKIADGNLTYHQL
jgi:uncharacterized protein (DUF488 family)